MKTTLLQKTLIGLVLINLLLIGVLSFTALFYSNFASDRYREQINDLQSEITRLESSILDLEVILQQTNLEILEDQQSKTEIKNCLTEKLSNSPKQQLSNKDFELIIKECFDHIGKD